MKRNIDIIQSFNDDFVEYFPPVSETDICKAEEVIKFKLPEDYISFLKFSNGITIDGDEVFGLNNKRYDLIKAYHIEHESVEKPMDAHIIPFSPDGGGNFYCFDLKLNNIIFWASGYDYSETDLPEIVNSSFTEWFREVMIDWTVENNGEAIFSK